MTDSDEVVLLRRRARRRLVGAIALVVFAVIVLPIIFDKEPKPISQDIVIEIPSQNSGRFNTRVVPSAPESGKAEARDETRPGEASVKQSSGAVVSREPVAEKANEPSSADQAKATAPAVDGMGKSSPAKAAGATKEAAKDAVKALDKPATSEAEAARAQAALQGEAYVVPLGAFLNQANVKSLQAKVTIAGFKSYSEIQKVPKGEQIRVRAGPFPTREAAERAREQLQSSGLTVGPVTKL